jgi:uncharacterized membrane protein
MERDNKIKEITMTALMAALVFVCTYAIRIPNPATGGYSHLGDCMIFLAVLILGRRNGALAAGIGGALSDLLAGAASWALPTFIIKMIMAFIMGTVIEKEPGSGKLQLIGSVSGGLFQIVAYTLVKVWMVGAGPAVASIPNVSIQTGVGIALFFVISRALMANRSAAAILTGSRRSVSKRSSK